MTSPRVRLDAPRRLHTIRHLSKPVIGLTRTFVLFSLLFLADVQGADQAGDTDLGELVLPGASPQTQWLQGYIAVQNSTSMALTLLLGDANGRRLAEVSVPVGDVVWLPTNGTGSYNLHMEPADGSKPAIVKKLEGLEFRETTTTERGKVYLHRLTLRDTDISPLLPPRFTGWIRKVENPREESEAHYGDRKDGWFKIFGTKGSHLFMREEIFQRSELIRKWETIVSIEGLPERIESAGPPIVMNVKGWVRADAGGYQKGGSKGPYWADVLSGRIWSEGAGLNVRGSFAVTFKNSDDTPLVDDPADHPMTMELPLPPREKLPDSFAIHIVAGAENSSGAYLIFRYTRTN